MHFQGKERQLHYRWFEGEAHYRRQGPEVAVHHHGKEGCHAGLD